MELQFNYDQRARLELLAIHAGTTPQQLILDAAQLLLERDASDGPVHSPSFTQRFLSEVELEHRFTRLLHS